MKKFAIKFISFIVCAVMLFSLSGCGAQEAIDIASLLPGSKLKEGVVAENSNYTLSWNDDEKCVVLTDKSTGDRLSTTPNEYMDMNNDEKQARVRNFLESPILVSYKVPGESSVAQARAYTHSINKGTFSAEAADGVITVTYYFKDADILVPVSYSLNETGFKMSIDPSKIVEGENPIYGIDVAPFLCSVPHGTADSYVFYPSGSGALISASDPVAESASYTAEVYGTDVARKIKNKLTNDKNIYLPVYGVKNGEKAVCAIISSGADSASITSTVSDTSTGYTTVYSTLNLRGNDYNFVEGSGGVDSTIYSEEVLNSTIFTVDFYPLSGADANYSGMAKTYQKALFGDNKAKEGVEDPVYSLKFVGGLLETENFLGFPYSKLLALTTYTDVNNILNELSEAGVKPNVQLYGFGSSGMDIEKVAGGFKLGGAFGSKAELAALTEYCKNNGIDSFVDFNISEFKKAGGGYNTFSTAKTASRMSAYVYQISKGAQILDTENYDRHRLMSRTKFDSISQKLLKKISKYSIDGISFESITANAYSDYTDSKYYVKANMGSQVSGIANSYKESGYKFAASGANEYAAKIADCIFNTPVNSSKLEMFTADVPFYQMVFKGKTEIATEPLNAGISFDKKKLTALESGSSMLFAIYNKYDLTLTLSQYKGLYGGVYASNKDNIIAVAKEFKDYYNAISGQTIVNHELLTNDVRCTTYSNGVKIYVNYSEKDYESPDGVVKAINCLVVK